MLTMIAGVVLGAILGAATAAWLGDEEYSNKTSLSIGAGVFVLVFGAFTAFASITRVGTGEIAVMTRFGQVTGQELTEGLNFHNPLDKPNKYDVKIQKREVEAAAASADLQDVSAVLGVNFRLSPGKVSEIHRTIGINYEDKLVGLAIQEVFKASTAKFDAIQLITDRPAVKSTAVEGLRERLEPFGIDVVDLSIINFSFSPEFTAAIEQKQVAQQNAERAKFNLEAAKTDAEAQKVQAETLSPLFLQKIFLEVWDGKLPLVMTDNTEGVMFNLGELLQSGDN